MSSVDCRVRSVGLHQVLQLPVKYKVTTLTGTHYLNTPEEIHSVLVDGDKHSLDLYKEMEEVYVDFGIPENFINLYRMRIPRIGAEGRFISLALMYGSRSNSSPDPVLSFILSMTSDLESNLKERNYGDSAWDGGVWTETVRKEMQKIEWVYL